MPVAVIMSSRSSARCCSIPSSSLVADDIVRTADQETGRGLTQPVDSAVFR